MINYTKFIIVITMGLSIISCTWRKNKVIKENDTFVKNNKALYKELDVSLINLIANPTESDGHKVRVIGYLNLEFEGDALYLNKEDYDRSIGKNALWIQISRDSTFLPNIKKCNQNYVLIEGTFRNTDGHMGMSSGSISDITRIELWTPLRTPSKPHDVVKFPPVK